MHTTRSGYFLQMLYLWMLVLSVCLLSGCTGKEELLFFPSEEPVLEETVIPVPEETPVLQERTLIYVNVQGAVQNPGVYELEEGSRVFLAVEAAGGFLEDARTDSINLARILRDEDSLYILSESETEALSEEMPLADSFTETTGDTKVDLNHAGPEELMTLTGIGEKRAGDILNYRETHGAFTSVEEIMNVPGIKEGTFEKIKDEIAVR